MYANVIFQNMLSSTRLGYDEFSVFWPRFSLNFG
jgi:hypothetical protein